MATEEVWRTFGGILATEIIPGLIGLYIGWKLLSYFTKSNEDKDKDEKHEH